MRAIRDFSVVDEGSILLPIPNTEKAHAWITNNLEVESYMMMGHNVAVDHRMFCPIAEGIENDGLILEEL